MEEKEYKRFTISLPPDLYEEFERFRKKLDIPRSDLIRKAMKALMISEENIPVSTGNVVGCITMIMGHAHFDIKEQGAINQDSDHSTQNARLTNHVSEHESHHLHDHQDEYEYISKPIYANTQQRDLLLSNDIQHHFADIIISTMHIHLEFEKCLEIIAVSGNYDRVKQLKNAFQKLKNVISTGFFIVDKENNFKKKDG